MATHSIAEITNRLHSIKKDIVDAMQDRLDSLGYSETADKDLTHFSQFIAKIVSNIEALTMKSIDAGGFGYTQTECNSLMSILKDGITYAKTLMTTLASGVTDTNKSVLKGNLDIVYLPKLDYSQITSAKELFMGNTNMITTPYLNLSADAITDVSYMFKDCTALKNIEGVKINTDNVTNIDGVFKRTTVCVNPFEMLFGNIQYGGKQWYDLSNIITCNYFYNPHYAVEEIGNIYLPNCTNMYGFLSMASNNGPVFLKKIGDVYAPKANMNGAFYYNCIENIGVITMGNNVNTLNMFSMAWGLKEIEGIKGCSSNLDMSSCRSLTALGIHKILQSLYDDDVADATTKKAITDKRDDSSTPNPTITFMTSRYNLYLNEYEESDASIRNFLTALGWIITTKDAS